MDRAAAVAAVYACVRTAARTKCHRCEWRAVPRSTGSLTLVVPSTSAAVTAAATTRARAAAAAGSLSRLAGSTAAKVSFTIGCDRRVY